MYRVLILVIALMVVAMSLHAVEKESEASRIMEMKSSEIPRERLISYWSGASGKSNGTRLDEIGSNHFGYASKTKIGPGKIGDATIFDGACYLRTTQSPHSNASSILSAGRSISYAGWIRLDSVSQEQTIIARWGAWAKGREFRLSFNPSKKSLVLEWANNDNQSQKKIISSVVCPSDQWVFVAFGQDNKENIIWLSVSPDNLSEPSKCELENGVQGNNSSSNSVLEVAAHDEHAFFKGAWNQWAILNGTLTEGEISWMFNAGNGRAWSDLKYVEEPQLEYFNDFEKDSHTRGRISYQKLFEETAMRSKEQAQSGDHSLKISGAWGQIQVFNNSNTNYWCTTTECRVSMDVYMTDFVGGSMLFQMDGKCDTKEWDTNEGLGVMFYQENDNRGFSFGSTRTSGYNIPLNKWVHIDYLWNKAALKPENGIELYADGKLILASQGRSAGQEMSSYEAKTWHHISVGNDRHAKPAFYLDNFEVSGKAVLPIKPKE